LRLSVLAAASLLAIALTAVPGPSARAQTLADIATAARAAGGAIFGSSEFRSESLSALPQWQRIVADMRKHRPAYEQCAADAAACGSKALKAWRELITQAAGLDPRGKLEAVNNFFNQWPYRIDSAVYGTREYWASPEEFMARSGDCEDYAIAKFFALRSLGFDNEDLRVVILWDQIRNIGHAVLAVYQPDAIYVLDNLSRLIAPDSRYKHYIPQYSMNETTRWAHVHQEKIPTLWAQRN